MDFVQRNRITEKTFGEFVKNKREQMELSARLLAQKLDISTVYLCDIETAKSPAPRKKTVLTKLVEVLCLSEDEVCFFYKAALASRMEDIDGYLAENPRVCMALRMAQELPYELVYPEWELFIERLIQIESKMMR